MRPSEHREKPGWHPDRPLLERMYIGMGLMALVGVGLLVLLLLLMVVIP